MKKGEKVVYSLGFGQKQEDPINTRYKYTSSNDKKMLVDSNLIVGRQVGIKSFKSKSYFESYMKALKWISKNILSNQEVNDCKFEFIKESDGKSISIKIYCTTSLKYVIERHCKACSENSECFWNEKTDCSVCHSRALRNRIEDITNDRADWAESCIKKIFEKEGIPDGTNKNDSE